MTSSTADRTATRPIPSTRRAQTRERLITAAVAVIAERGIIGASVEEISERAGFTRGAFYSNFTGKDDLVLAILQHYAERDLQAVHEITDTLVDRTGPADGHLTDRPPGALINLALTRLFGDAAHDRDAILARNELNLYAIRQPELRAVYREYLDRLYDRISELVGRTLRAIGVEFTIEYRVAIPLLHACSSGIEMTALLSDTPADPGPMETLIKAITRPC